MDLISGYNAPDAPEIEAGRLLFAGECTFLLGMAHLSQLPTDALPEIAFAGRSNVGKSSLLNALTGRKTLARTSNTPGRTQQINFFNLADRLMLADLPGYGYAKVSKSLSKEWNILIRTYLRGRAPLRRVCMLVDSRHGIKDNDREIMDMLDESAVNYMIVLTKADKIKKSAQETVQEKTQEALASRPAAFPFPMLTSSEKGTGIPELRAELARLGLATPI